jgi:hypothetical protein
MSKKIKRIIAVITAALTITGIVNTVSAEAGMDELIKIPAAKEPIDSETVIQPLAAVNTPETYINLDFDHNGRETDFKNERYERSTRTIETDSETGNKFIRFTYNTENTEAPLYSEDMYPTSGAYSNLDITGNIVMSFDVHFGNNDGTIYLKNRHAGVNDIVLRVGARDDGRLVYGSDGGVKYFYRYSNGDYFKIDSEKWYNVQIMANITSNSENAKQSIYIFDKQTGILLSKAENVSLNKAVSSCNLVMVGTSHYVDLDNLIIEESDIQSLRIVGTPYPACGNTNEYSVRGITKSGVALYKNDITPVWSLVNNITGVFIGEVTGELITAENASLSPAIIKASAEIDGVLKDWYYLVEIEK